MEKFEKGDLVKNKLTKHTAIVVEDSPATALGYIVNIQLKKGETKRAIWHRDNMILISTPSVPTPNFDIEKEKIRISAEARSRRVRILKLQNA